MLLLPFHIFGQIYNYTNKVLNEYISQWYFPNGIHDVSLPGEKSVPFYISWGVTKHASAHVDPAEEKVQLVQAIVGQ